MVISEIAEGTIIAAVGAAFDTAAGVRSGELGRVLFIRPTSAQPLYGVDFERSGFDLLLHQELQDPRRFEPRPPGVAREN